MRILFLGDVVGVSGCSKIAKNLLNQIKKNNIDFVIVNGENAAEAGVGLTKEICQNFFNCGVNVITTGNHVWDQKDIMDFIDKENRLLRPKNLFEPSPGKGFEVYTTEQNIKIGVLNLMGNVFMKKCDDVFEISEKFLKKYKLKEDYDILIVDFHGEITSEKNAIGHFFDGKATLVIGTHTHIPTNDARVLKNGTAYQTDAGMCGDYDSVIGMNKDNSLNRFMKKDSVKHFPAKGDATLCGVIVDCNIETGLANKIESYIFGGQLNSAWIIMAGHSHWAGIKHKKGKADKQRSKIFSKLSKEITVAAKLGDKDPAMNARLRSAIQAARTANMPKDNIERAIDKSSVNTELNFENLRYEGFGPYKVAVIVETLTENKNRTASNIRTIFQKAGGSLGTQGSASHNFNQLGIIKIDKKEISDEYIFELALEAGADECKTNDDFHEIQCHVSEIYNVKKELEKKVTNFISTEIEWIPLNSVEISKEKNESLINFFDSLEEDDDVQNFYSNAKFV